LPLLRDALLTASKQDKIVRNLSEPMPRGYVLGPPFDLVVLEFDRHAATPAHEVMVMPGGTTDPVDGLAVFSPKDIDLGPRCHRLEIPVDRRQADLLPAQPEGFEKVLRALETIRFF
jgi:hypothetical protein